MWNKFSRVLKILYVWQNPFSRFTAKMANINSAEMSTLKVVLIQIQELRWCKANRKPNEKQKFSHSWPYTHICFRSHSTDLEQAITIIIALKMSPFSFWYLIQTGKVKGGILDKILFILNFGRMTIQFHSPTSAFSCYLAFLLRGIINWLSWNNFSFKLCSPVQD